MTKVTIYSEEKGLYSLPPEKLTKWDSNSSENIWVDLYGPKNEESVRILESVFGFHPLAIEDALKYTEDSEVHHPKIDDFEDYLFIIFNGIKGSQAKTAIEYFSLSCFLGHNFLVTIHNEKPENILDVATNNFITASAFKKGPDFILHLIFDSIVDNYYPVIDEIDNKISEAESTIFKSDPHNRILVTILNLKKDLIKMMRYSSYQREVLYKLTRADSDLISMEESIYYRNVYDHLVRISDSAESYRDYVTGVLESYLSIVNNRLNETMKFLTLVATIMLPLTFITGVFGMNFDHIPFLHSQWGFWLSISSMLAVVITMVWWFKKRRII